MSQCPRCQAPLKLVTVRIPVSEEKLVYPELGLDGYRLTTTYVQREEYADCVRCTGAY